MRTRYIPAGVMLVAGAVTCVVSIVQDQDIVKSLINLLVVLILFYVIGLVAKFFIEKILKDLKENKNLQQPDEDDTSNDSEKNSENVSVDVENSPDINDRNRI